LYRQDFDVEILSSYYADKELQYKPDRSTMGNGYNLTLAESDPTGDTYATEISG